MSALLFLLSVMAVMAAVLLSQYVTGSAVREIEVLIMLLTGAVLLTGSGIVSAVNAARKAIESQP